MFCSTLRIYLYTDAVNVVFKGLLAAAHMKQGIVIELDSDLAIYAAKIGKEYKLAMADSIIYAVTKKHNSLLWTQDKHFKNLENVKYFEKKK